MCKTAYTVDCESQGAESADVDSWESKWDYKCESCGVETKPDKDVMVHCYFCGYRMMVHTKGDASDI